MSNSSENFRAASGMVTVESSGANIVPKIVGGNASATKSVTYISGASPQDVIKNFMASLDQTNLSGESALDEAISACSNGAFSTIQEAIDQMVSDCRTSSSANAFLADYCGIDLNNADTGAITGYF